MAAKTEIDTAKIGKLLEAGRDLHAKLGDILTEIDALLGGAAGIGAAMGRAMGTFDALWGERYASGQPGRYVWRQAPDRAQIKRLIKFLGVEELEARMARYLRDSDPFCVRSRHGFSVFVSSINAYAAPGGDRPQAAPVFGCDHDPRCGSDQEHTQKHVAEMRA